MVKRGDMKYVTYEIEGWPDQLFDLAADPAERINLTGKPAYAEMQRTLAERADEFHATARRPPFPVETGRWVYSSGG
jgi:hypothetical protein